MKKIKMVIGIVGVMLLNSCVEEKDMTPDCGKWEVEINNPEATVNIENGLLIIDIPNPETAKDVRMIQRQAPDVNDGEIAMAVDIENLSWEGIEGRATYDPQISISSAYVASPDQPILRATYNGFKNVYYVNGSEVFSRQEGRYPNELMFYASGEIVEFERDSRQFATSLISAAQKLVYLDFGIEPSARPTNTASMHVEIDLVIFGDYTKFISQSTGLVLVTGYNPTKYGFYHDPFECNSLIR
ncbi:MAG: hypothetical protein CMB80_19400 [Flammeovirgaceae bacterium]|nr:hypothetical protein [Flammeovirgaceae bacterium]MBE62507.1 hypothetical protein [Flammeovirgaceae bacterium]HCX22061.1 hypothetical protein [Cytophagales bacterium]|tara:strand:+ start:2066 stop:2794 length:729 start_codon:yes stop_codon:yes gene_type:complete